MTFLDIEESTDVGSLLLTDIPLPLGSDIIDEEAVIRSSESGVLPFLLVLLSFKLRRRTVFLLRIRLKYNTKKYINYSILIYEKMKHLLETGFPFTE